MKEGYKVVSDFSFNKGNNSILVFNLCGSNKVICMPLDIKDMWAVRDNDSVGKWKIKNLK